jgi:nucleoside-triphosphatase
VGKSTIVRRVAEELKQTGVQVGGMTTADIRSGSERVGFEIRNLLTGEVGVLAHANRAAGLRIGRYRVDSEDLDRIGTAAVLSAISAAKLVVIDEVGPMELTSARFKDAVRAALGSQKPIIGTVHRNAQDPLVREIKSDPKIEITEVTHGNRNTLAKVLVERFRAALG